MKPTYRDLLTAMSDQPLALYRMALPNWTLDGMAEVEPMAAVRANPQAPGSVAVIPLVGMTQKREDIWTRYGFATSTDALVRAVQQAVNDPTIKAIVFDVDSPGGYADGNEEASAAIRSMRGSKPMVAVANTMMASAAYYLASAADEVVASPSASVGSIGVWTMHVDESAADEMAGIKVSMISAGKYKVSGHPFEPLDEEARGRIQEAVNQHYAMFVNAVAKNRGVTASAVRGGYGEGGILMGAAAQEAGLVDRVATLEETIRRFAGGKAGARAEGETSAPKSGIAALQIERARLELTR